MYRLKPTLFVQYTSNRIPDHCKQSLTRHNAFIQSGVSQKNAKKANERDRKRTTTISFVFSPSIGIKRYFAYPEPRSLLGFSFYAQHQKRNRIVPIHLSNCTWQLQDNKIGFKWGLDAPMQLNWINLFVDYLVMDRCFGFYSRFTRVLTCRGFR